MSKKNSSARSPNQQALTLEIYMNLIPLVLRRGKASHSLNEANSRPWLDTATYMKSITTKPNSLIVSAAEACAKSAICHKLRKLDTDDRHEIVVSFLINKLIPLLDVSENANWSWTSNKGTIVRIFENDLIDQYRKANTRQGRLKKEIIPMGFEFEEVVAAYDNKNMYAHEAELIEEDLLMSVITSFHAFVKTLSERDRAIIISTLLLGKTSKEAAQIFGLHEVTVRNKRAEIMAAFRASLNKSDS